MTHDNVPRRVHYFAKIFQAVLTVQLLLGSTIPFLSCSVAVFVLAEDDLESRDMIRQRIGGASMGHPASKCLVCDGPLYSPHSSRPCRYISLSTISQLRRVVSRWCGDRKYVTGEGVSGTHLSRWTTLVDAVTIWKFVFRRLRSGFGRTTMQLSADR